MLNRIIAALLVVSLTACSIIPRAAPQAATPATVATEQMPDVNRASEGAPADSGPGSTVRDRAILGAVLIVLFVALTYAVTIGLSNSIANSCCYK